MFKKSMGKKKPGRPKAARPKTIGEQMDSTSERVFQSLKFVDGERVTLGPRGTFSETMLPGRAEIVIDDRVDISSGKRHEAGPLMSAADAILVLLHEDEEEGSGRPFGTPVDVTVAVEAFRRQHPKLLVIRATADDVWPWIGYAARSRKPHRIVSRVHSFSVCNFAWGEC